MTGEDMRPVRKLGFVNPQYLLMPMLQIPEDVWIKSLVLISMILQILLILAGGLRYRCKSQLLTTIGWLAYMSADGVAMYAMAAIMDSSRTSTQMVYAVWAPLLLIHLGGPDTITAYSMADNEIWNRHGVTMLYHVGVAAYVIYTFALEAAGKVDGEWLLVAVAVLLFVAGSIKYAERTIALRLASASQIVSSALPIHRFMQHEHEIPKESDGDEDEDEWNYIVMGEEDFYDELWSKGSYFEWTRRNLRRLGVVTLQDVWEHEGRLETETYRLCASFAAFKIYTRRFARLPFPEGDHQKTGRFFTGRFDGESIETISKWRIAQASRWDLEVGEKEMKFMYEYLFSKSRVTAYSKCGTAMRLINTSLLALACFLLFSKLQGTAKNDLQHQLRGEQMVTYVLLCVALGLEVLQLCRILLSDWTMVWLICAYIRCVDRSEHTEYHRAKLTKTVMFALARIRKLVGVDDWQKKREIQIPQLNVIDSCLSSPPLIWKFPEAFGIRDFLNGLYFKALVPCCIRASKHTEEDIMLWFFSAMESGALCNQHKVYEMMHSTMPFIETKSMEVEILACHLATTMCERLDEEDIESTDDEDLKKNFRIAGMVSRYMAYLVVTCPHILPVHPDKANMEYEKAYSQIAGFVNNEMKNASRKEFWKMLKDHKSARPLGAATNLARELLSKTLADRWSTIRSFWALTFFYCVFYSKAAVHAERLTIGGELLTLKWVQYGHMGRGEQSDSAVCDRTAEWRRKREL